MCHQPMFLLQRNRRGAREGRMGGLCISRFKKKPLTWFQTKGILGHALHSSLPFTAGSPSSVTSSSSTAVTWRRSRRFSASSESPTHAFTAACISSLLQDTRKMIAAFTTVTIVSYPYCCLLPLPMV